MIKSEKSVVIDAPIEKVFAYLIDPANVPEYHVGTHVVTDVQRLPNGGYRFKMPYKVVGLSADMTSEDLEVVPNERVVSKWDSSLMDGVITYRFERLEGGKTRVSIVAETTLHGGPLAKLGDAFFAKYFDHGEEMTIATAKARIEGKELAATPG